MFVNLSGHAGQIGEHGRADCAGDFVIGERVQTDIDDAAPVDDVRPDNERPGILQIVVFGRDQCRHLAGGQLFQKWI